MAALEVLTLDEVAALLRLSPATVLREAREGRLPGRRIGEEWRFSRAHVLDWLRGDAEAEAPAPTPTAEEEVPPGGGTADEQVPPGETLERMVAREGGGEPTPAEQAARDEDDALGER